MKTKQCKKCGNMFECTTKLDGKTIRLFNRVFCLICSPYGKHNTIDLSGYKPDKQVINGVPHKKCRACKILKPLIEFYAKSEWGRRYAVCGLCSRNLSKKRRNERKQRCVNYKGGKCIVCGYNKCLRSLEFHHTDETEKDYGISTSWKKPKEEIIKELDKCILLCSNCHGEVHDGVLKL